MAPTALSIRLEPCGRLFWAASHRQDIVLALRGQTTIEHHLNKRQNDHQTPAKNRESSQGSPRSVRMYPRRACGRSDGLAVCCWIICLLHRGQVGRKIMASSAKLHRTLGFSVTWRELTTAQVDGRVLQLETHRRKLFRHAKATHEQSTAPAGPSPYKLRGGLSVSRHAVPHFKDRDDDTVPAAKPCSTGRFCLCPD